MRFDYSTYAAFRTIDRHNDGFVDTYNLGIFLKNNGHYASEKELLAIIRRIDTDGDAKLSYSEFSEFLSGSHPLRQSLEDSSKTRSYSHERNQRSLNASTYNSPLKNRSSSTSYYARAHSASHNTRHAAI